MSDLQEAHSHQEQTVGADPAGENFIEISLQEELLQHQDQVRQDRVFLQSNRHHRNVDHNTLSRQNGNIFSPGESTWGQGEVQTL